MINFERHEDEKRGAWVGHGLNCNVTIWDKGGLFHNHDVVVNYTEYHDPEGPDYPGFTFKEYYTVDEIKKVIAFWQRVIELREQEND